MTREEFFALVRKAQSGDDIAMRELRSYADNPRRRSEAAARAYATRPAMPTKRTTSKVTPKRTTPTPKPKHQQLTISGQLNGLTINRAAVERAIEILGIRKPVTIRWAGNLPENATGEHDYTAQDDHVIHVGTGRSAEATSRTVIHELAHAATAETFPSRHRWHRAYLDDTDAYEEEAIEVARVLAHLRPVR